jgi:DNA-binding NarL/FixJ family response regulator
MLQAKSYPEIARELGLTWGTIKNRVRIMFWKAGVNSATGVARIKFTTWAHEHRGLLGIRCQACGERN